MCHGVSRKSYLSPLMLLMISRVSIASHFAVLHDIHLHVQVTYHTRQTWEGQQVLPILAAADLHYYTWLEYLGENSTNVKCHHNLEFLAEHAFMVHSQPSRDLLDRNCTVAGIPECLTWSAADYESRKISSLCHSQKMPLKRRTLQSSPINGLEKLGYLLHA